ncbi:hypothetical protein [Mixta gaviniae]|uniref:hypothetical protein n=1 Tax=Mixta gaviniae TaxID=665914 RepID=UPI00142D4789|nr:hypothetical protein [Mixta gaviniae]
MKVYQAISAVAKEVAEKGIRCLIEPAIEILKDPMALTRMNKPVDIAVHIREFQKKEQE